MSSRYVRRVPYGFNYDPEARSPWWGLALDPIQCRDCRGEGKNRGTLHQPPHPRADEECATCYGSGFVYPRIEPPGYDGHGSGPHDRVPGIHFIDDRYGWQMWEGVSEGSPYTPVFRHPRELALYLANGGERGIHANLTADEWYEAITGLGDVWMVGTAQGMGTLIGQHKVVHNA